MKVLIKNNFLPQSAMLSHLHLHCFQYIATVYTHTHTSGSLLTPESPITYFITFLSSRFMGLLTFWMSQHDMFNHCNTTLIEDGEQRGGIG